MENTCDPVVFPHSDVTRQIIACFLDVAHELGHGYSEAVFCSALAIALTDAGLKVRTEVPMKVQFRGRVIGTFEADIVVENVILLEIKATAEIEPWAQAQLLNYLKVAGGGVGLLLNFGRRANWKRMVMGDPNAGLPGLVG